LFAAIHIALVVGCSWYVDFAVSNRSEAPIEIAYAYVGESDCPLSEHVPAVSSTKPMGWWRPHAEWQDLGEGEYQFVEEGCSIAAMLQPDTAFLLLRWPMVDATALEEFSLQIRSESGSITLAGLELSAHFSRRHRSLYELPYRSPEVSSSAPPANE
jgi:hypothetical protein